MLYNAQNFLNFEYYQTSQILMHKQMRVVKNGWKLLFIEHCHDETIAKLPERCTLHKKWSFQLRISSVNVTKSTISCGFDHIYWKIHLLSSAICYLMHCSLFSAFRSFLYSDRIWTREFSFSVVLYRESGHIQISKMERFDEIVNGI